jgi:hexulose-6-phosphate isomerase
MLKSVSVWALKDNAERPAEELFAEAREHGFDGVEPAVGTEGLVTPETTAEDCQALLQTAREEGVVVSSLASGLGWEFPLTADEAEVRQRGIELVRRSLRAASWLGVEALLVVPGTLAPWTETSGKHVAYDVAFDRMQAGIAELVPTAEEVGVAIAIENVWNKLLLSPLEMREFIDGFRSDAVGAYLDVGNVIAFGYAEDWIRILGPRVRSVHFKDFKRSVGTSAGFCDLLEGDVSFPAVMEALRAIGYDGPCVAEFFQLDTEGLDRLSTAMDEILAM